MQQLHDPVISLSELRHCQKGLLSSEKKGLIWAIAVFQLQNGLPVTVHVADDSVDELLHPGCLHLHAGAQHEALVADIYIGQVDTRDETVSP